VLRTALPLAAALLALAVPASAQAGFTAHRTSLTTAPKGAQAKHRAPARVAQECANADLVPDAGNLPAVRSAILCLHNQARAQRGLPSLGADGRLRRAAAGHSADMVRGGYFDHTAPSGVTMVDRIMRAGYVPPNRGWMMGENLEWGTGRLATPRSAMQGWMDSPGHRANILRRGYEELGVGISLGTPDSSDGATYTVDFGAVR